MPRPGRELLHLTAPVALAPQDSDDTTTVVKGFASVENSESDRSGDVVPPDEFDIEKFMVAPTLLVNHKFWLDHNGNGIAVGRPTEMHAVKIADIGDDKEWGVIDLGSKEQVNTFPKAQIPRLRPGDRGLFVVADVTVDDVAKMVKSGELSTFSWRGLVSVDYRVNDRGTTERVLRDIDLYEVSLTHIPDQTSAQAVVVKSADGVDRRLPLSVYAVRLEKSKYESKELAEAYFKTHNLQCDAVKDENDSFYGFQRKQSDFDANQLVTVKMADGVHIIAGPLKPESEDGSFAWVTQSLGSEEAEKLATLDHTSEETEMSDDAKKVDDEVVESQDETTATATEEIVEDQEVVSQSQEQMEAFAGTVAEKTAAGVAAALGPMFETMTQSFTNGITELAEKGAMKEKMGHKGGAGGGGAAGAKDEEDEEKEEARQGAGYGDKMKKAKKKNAEETETENEEAEVAKSAGDFDQVMGVLNALASNLKQTQEQVVEVAKTAEGIGKAMPEGVNRDEKIDVEKGAEGDLNSVFDSTFPFLGNVE